MLLISGKNKILNSMMPHQVDQQSLKRKFQLAMSFILLFAHGKKEESAEHQQTLEDAAQVQNSHYLEVADHTVEQEFKLVKMTE